jgi:hypothetical protein
MREVDDWDISQMKNERPVASVVQIDKEASRTRDGCLADAARLRGNDRANRSDLLSHE